MKKVIGIGVVVFSFFLLITCTYRANEPDVCFSNDILPVIVSKCGGCHAKYTNYDGIMRGITKFHPLRSEIYNQVRGANPSMPPDGHNKLTAHELYMLKVWISKGATNSSSCGTCDTSLYKFSADIKPIFNNWCVSCHTTGNAGGGYDFSAYAGIASSVTNGRLLGSIEHLTGYSPMPQNGTLNSCDLTKIQNWVKAGYPNN